MDWNYAYTPQIWPSFLTVLFLLVLSVFSWRRRSVPGALLFSLGSLLAGLWVAGSLMEYAAVDLADKIIWIKFQAAWQLPATTLVTCFILEYTWPGRWLTRRNLALLSIAPLLALGLILTNDLHHLMWLGFEFNGSVIPVRGPASWPFFIYSYGLGLIVVIVYVWLFMRSPQHRWPVAIMLAGVIGARAAYLLEIASIIRPHLSIDVLVIVYLFLMYSIALFGFRILDPIPLARQTVVTQMRDGMLVLDPRGRVADLNPAAEGILGVKERRALGRPIQDVLPAYMDSGQDLQTAGSSQAEICLGAGPEARYYALATSALKDWRGLTIGQLLLLHDVTGQKHAHAQIVEQQRSLATLQERERLARELHDSLGQTLAAAHMQASTARMLLAQGKTAQMDECLEQLADMTIAAEVDVREYLLGAKTFFSAGLPFFAALRQYILRFSQQYGLHVGLDVPPQLEGQGLSPAVELQLLRIIQEALSNVRKHARARSVQVIFTAAGALVQAAIIDDGQGFDAVSVAARRADGFGLQAMRERAEALGGCFEILSQPGQGTRVIVQFPVRRDVIIEELER